MPPPYTSSAITTATLHRRKSGLYEVFETTGVYLSHPGNKALVKTITLSYP
jgi:hypothetical protein